MTDEQLEALKDARHTLLVTATFWARKGASSEVWLFDHAQQWALNLLTPAEVNAIVAFVWGD